MQLLLELDDVPEPIHDCIDRNSDYIPSMLEKVDHPANSLDWSMSHGSQSYQVFRCSECKDYWGCRFQYDAGTGHDDRWHRFGEVDPNTIKRHY